jgi:hypothetical protein
MKATCIKCGDPKKLPWHTAANADLWRRVRILVKSVYCSVGRFTDNPEEETGFEGEIDQISRDIQAGRKIHYDDRGLQRLREQQMDVETASKNAFVYLLRVFFPAIVLLAVMYVIIWWIGK